MIGRLVEQQEIGTAHQGTGQVETYPESSGKRRHRPVFVARHKTEPHHQLGGATLGPVAVDGLQCVMQVRLLDAIPGRLGLGQCPAQPGQFDVALDHILKGRHRQRRGLLSHLGNHPACGIVQVTLIRVQFPKNQGEQAGFSRAIGPRHPDPAARRDLERGGFEKGATPTGQGEGFQVQHDGWDNMAEWKQETRL
ncbi:hypothetical protein CCP4SC76_7860027 [Gammaproteobacteria bacterium]